MKKVISMVVLICFFIAGCASTHPFKQSIMVDKDSPLNLKAGGKYYVLKFKDNTGNNIDMSNNIMNKMNAKGMIWTTDESKADYIINCNLTFIDVLDKHPDKNAIAAVLGGAAAGALTGGILVYNNNFVPWQAGLIGLGAGLLVGGVSTAIERANRQIPYYATMNVDVQTRDNFIGRTVPLNQPVVDKTMTITKDVAPAGKCIPDKVKTTEVVTKNFATEYPTAQFKTNTSILKGVVVAKGANHSIPLISNQMADLFANSIASNF
jgi:hypothetical protein